MKSSQLCATAWRHQWPTQSKTNICRHLQMRIQFEKTFSVPLRVTYLLDATKLYGLFVCLWTTAKINIIHTQNKTKQNKCLKRKRALSNQTESSVSTTEGKLTTHTKQEQTQKKLRYVFFSSFSDGWLAMKLSILECVSISARSSIAGIATISR